MKDTDYRDILRDMPCCFCSKSGEGLVSWHHLKCLGASGSGQRAQAAFTIPVCKFCHTDGLANCHNYGINRDTQKLALMNTWQNVMRELKTIEQYNKLLSDFGVIDIQQLGRTEAWKRKGKLFWAAIGGENAKD